MLRAVSRRLPRARAELVCLTIAAWSISEFPNPLAGQIVLKESAECPQCRITLTHSALLGSAEGPATLGGVGSVARTGSGRYFVATPGNNQSVLVFDKAGRYLRSLGRPGEGPGEFRSVWRVMADGDRIHVFDGRLSRETVFSTEDFRLLRTTNIPGPLINIAVVGENELVVNASFRSPELIGFPLHVIRQGAVTSSFGESGAAYRTDLPYLGMREIAPARASGSFWSAHKTRYVIERWDYTGTMTANFQRDVSWFKPHNRGLGFDPSTPPAPVLLAIAEDGGGILWTLTAVADPDWRAALEIDERHRDGERYVPGDMSEYLDTMIEAIDPSCGVVLSSARVDRYIPRFASRDHVAGPRTDADGNPFVDVWRLQLKRGVR